ncbi:MAG: 3-hydroxyisobutyrate dehydrogenase [Desulfurellales bacterium]|nr:MAG: 3-hydroxyisobutyrate dehydrogenase [Desulfurellales bacterium]
MRDIAFIGLGAMGSGMAANLAKAGHQVFAFDLNPSAVAKAAAAGATPAASIEAAVSAAEIVVTMLPTGQHVADVYRRHVFGSARSGALLIDSSTIEVTTARSVIAEAEAAGFAMVDAPVSGGTAAAAGGTLTFMVGGAPEEFRRAEPVLAGMGKAVIHAGAAGAGQAAKICNNMLLAISMIGTCEAFALAGKLGLDHQVFFDIASKSSGQCWSMTSYCPVPGPVPAAPSNRDYEGGFATDLMAKDLRLAMDAAASVGAATPLGAQARALYQLFQAQGAGGRDFSAIIKMLG